MKNILLLFLSPFQVVEKDDKITIRETPYNNIEGEPTKSTNESAVRWLLQKNLPIDRIFILASKTVREDEIKTRTNELYLDESGNPQTHLNYFKEHMSKFLPNIDNCINENSIYEYDEESSGSQNLMSVAKIAGRIQDYAAKIKEDTGEEVTLHVDLTGGMRQVNMMMLDVIRLIEYSGIEIGSLLYSNYQTRLVEEVNNIYDLFQLISGVEEFVRFGSVKALSDYYKKHTSEKSSALNRLIDSMENFSEEIKLCHYGQFKKSIIELHDAIHDFKPQPDNLQDLLMMRLISRIRKNYSSLIVNRDLDDLKVIRWCVDNGYMQQALTLYTERIPEYIGEHGIIKQTPEESKKLEDQVGKDKMRRNSWYYLLNVCESRVIKGTSAYCNAIKNALNLINKKIFDYDKWFSELNEQLKSQRVSCKNENHLRQQMDILNHIRQDYKILLDLSSSELNPLSSILKNDKLAKELEKEDKGFNRKNKIFQFIQNDIKNDDMDLYFPPLQFDKHIADKYPKSFKHHEMIYNKIFSVTIPEDTFLEIMENYYRLVNERNHSNHARDRGEFTKAEDLKQFIVKELDRLEEIINNYEQ